MTKLLIGVMGIVLAGAVFFFYTSPAYGNVQAVRAQIADYDQALDKAAQLQQLKQSLLSRYNSFDQSDLARLQEMLPDHVDNVRLILDLDNLARTFGMALANVDVATRPTDNQTAVGVIGANSEKYDSLTIHFTTTGTYENFLGFLESLQSSLRIVDLGSLTITPENTGRGSAPSYRYDVTLITYWLK